MLLAIDPGLQGTGAALFDTGRHAPAAAVPIAVTVLPRVPKGEWWERALDLALQLNVWVQPWANGPLGANDFVVCEFPQYQESAGRSMGWRTGDLQKLTFLTGVFAERFRFADFYPVVPSQWKGTLPKHVVEMRIRERLTPRVCRDLGIKTHAWDAVGIGLWAIDHGIVE